MSSCLAPRSSGSIVHPSPPRKLPFFPNANCFLSKFRTTQPPTSTSAPSIMSIGLPYAAEIAARSATMAKDRTWASPASVTSTLRTNSTAARLLRPDIVRGSRPTIPSFAASGRLMIEAPLPVSSTASMSAPATFVGTSRVSPVPTSKGCQLGGSTKPGQYDPDRGPLLTAAVEMLAPRSPLPSCFNTLRRLTYPVVAPSMRSTQSFPPRPRCRNGGTATCYSR